MIGSPPGPAESEPMPCPLSAARLLPAALALAATLAGCSGPALLVGAQASQAGVSLFDRRGGFDAWHLARFDAVEAALRHAAGRMGLTLVEDELEEGRAWMVFETDRGEEVEVEVLRHGEGITVTAFEVGWFGSAGLARLLFKLTVSELSRSGAYPELHEHAPGGAVTAAG